jgi:fermentation-respiration switch protein FrsA (DUF1100 family)
MQNNAYFIPFKCPSYLLPVLLVLFFFASQIALGQQSTKRNLTPADYHLWHTLALEAISDDGNWVTYRHYYEDTDTLFVHNRKSKKVLSFAKATSGTFIKDYYVCGTADELHMVSLKTGSIKVVKGVQQFKAYESFIVTAQQNENENVTVVINYYGKELYTDPHVFEYQVSPDEKWVSLVQREDSMNTFVLLSTKEFVPIEVLKQPIGVGLFSLMAWSAGSGALAFYGTNGPVTQIHYYHLGRRTLQTFTNSFGGFPSTMHFYVRGELNLSADGNRVFFKIRQKPELNVVRPTNGVQVWNANDAQIYPLSIFTEGYTQNPKCAMWEPAENRFLEITDTKYPVGGAGGNSTLALVYNPLTHSASDKFVHDADFYITDLSKNAPPKLMAKNVIGGSTNVFVSPTGKYVCYFEHGQWKVYTVATGVTTTVTATLPVSFSIESMTEPDENSYGHPGWSSNETYLLLYDEFDVWKIKPDGSHSERLTRGREAGIKYRLLSEKKGQSKTNDGRIVTVGTFDLGSKLLLNSRSISNGHNGFAVWHPNNKLQTICYVPKAINGIVQSENGTFVWSEEDVAQSPTLMLRKGTGKVEQLHASNKQQQYFNWTKAEVLHYKNSEGIPIRGILYYPASYVSDKMYPMVVHIYQKQSNSLHKYTLPTLLNGDGFNKTNLTSKDYFVLLPDITYRAGAIGASAVDCVEAAVRKALENPAIDAKNVGLIGHSFGGTQTDFIITQSELFKCAVAGAATTDFISSHLSVTPNYKIPNFYKIERAQARMMVSPFEDWERYLKNSAVFHAAKISTPLLSWTGDRDGQVDYTQSIAFYLALRRLKKEHTMLVYPTVDHDMSGRKEAADLTQKIEDWLDYYLKNSAKPNWL